VSRRVESELALRASEGQLDLDYRDLVGREPEKVGCRAEFPSRLRQPCLL
jgi:hypothetical protein